LKESAIISSETKKIEPFAPQQNYSEETEEKSNKLPESPEHLPAKETDTTQIVLLNQNGDY